MEAAYGAPKVLHKEQGPVYVRFISNVGEAHVRRAHTTSHMVKRSAAKMTAWGGVPLPVLTALAKHENKPTTYMYQEMETVEYNDFRQSLNAPSHLRPRSRAFSNLDSVAAIRAAEHRILKMMNAHVEQAHEQAYMVTQNSLTREQTLMRSLFSLLSLQAPSSLAV